MNLLDNLKNLQAQVNQIFESNVSWEVKYDLIFSKHLSGKINDLITLDYYDPDTDYKEDVTAFVTALNDKLQDLSPIE
jgi:hypothetical protein